MRATQPIALRPEDFETGTLCDAESRLAGADARVADLPEAIRGLVYDLIEGLRSGRAYVLADIESYLTPAQAAEVLGVSRTYVSRLIRAGRLKAEKVGSHHRIPFNEIALKLEREKLLSLMRNYGHDANQANM